MGIADEAILTDTRSLRSGFLNQVRRIPNNPALIVEERIYTYAEIDDTARRWAAGLVNGTGKRPQRVGVFAYRNATAYIGVLASLFAGAGFVPLNRKFPLERTRTMLEQADVDALIVGKESFPQLVRVLTALPRLPTILLPDLDGPVDLGAIQTLIITRSDLAKAPPLISLPTVEENDLAYLLFTSGSTGIPKGVPINQRNVLAFLDVNKDRYKLTSEDRLTQTFDQTFDLSVFDLFMAWESGACVCSMQAIELLSPFRFLQEHNITLWFSVPSVASFLIKRGTLTPDSMPTLRWSLFCGEAMPRATIEMWQLAAPNSIIESLYGPTELTIACAAYRWDRGRSPTECVNDIVPIGHVYPTLTPRVVDDTLKEVPQGEIGELCVAGPQVTPGYWRASELSRDRFFEVEDGGQNTWTYYRTGDLVRKISDKFVFLGRRDQQVKVGGYRVELGEVEAVLLRAGCIDAFAFAWPDEREATGIAAVVSGYNDLSALASIAGDSLPSYMVPKIIERRDDLPLNPNGKVDRKALHRWLEIRVQVGKSGGVGMGEPISLSEPSQMKPLEPLIARALGIDVERVTDDLSYQSISEWDSLRHVELMLAVESEFDTRISGDLVLQLKSVKAIRAFSESLASGKKEMPTSLPASAKAASAVNIEVHRGLEGVYVDRSTITLIDGQKGLLEYRGYSIHDLVDRSSFEETTWLLLKGELPSAPALQSFTDRLRGYREVPPEVIEVIRALARAHPTEALRTGVSALGALRSDGRYESDEAGMEAGLQLIAKMPTLISVHHAIRSGREPLPSEASLSHAENFLYLLFGERASPNAVRLLDHDLILHADHGASASTFATRICVGCKASMYASITAAISAFSGALHGGAAERVIELIEAVDRPENAATYVRRCLDNNQPIMGFGHRVYKTEDPRTRHLREASRALSQEREDMRGFEIIEAVVEAMAPYARHGVGPNVDLYAGLAYRLLGLPDDLAVPIFVAGRIAGWIAQALEQRSNNVLIRPLFHYVGSTSREYLSVHERPA